MALSARPSATAHTNPVGSHHSTKQMSTNYNQLLERSHAPYRFSSFSSYVLPPLGRSVSGNKRRSRKVSTNTTTLGPAQNGTLTRCDPASVRASRITAHSLLRWSDWFVRRQISDIAMRSSVVSRFHGARIASGLMWGSGERERREPESPSRWLPAGDISFAG